MDKETLVYKISASMFRKNINNIHSLKDLYREMTEDLDISNINTEILLESKRVFEWILEHPEYDYTQLTEYDYSNEMLYNYFNIYYKDIIFKLDKHFKGDTVIKLTEIAKL